LGLLRGTVPDEAAAYAAAASPRLLRVARNLTRDVAAAEDLVQDTLVKVLTNWEKVSASEGVDAYVRRIMVNTFVSGKRLKRAGELVSHEVATADRYAARADFSAGVDEREELRERLEGLTRNQRAVLVLRYYEDLSDAQIAELLGLTPGNVRVTAHRALAALRARGGEPCAGSSARHTVGL
jgi:RNA polymerase sigma-70 factor (sigma-E family)